jgi:hypothetical protein
MACHRTNKFFYPHHTSLARFGNKGISPGPVYKHFLAFSFGKKRFLSGYHPSVFRLLFCQFAAATGLTEIIIP